MADQVGVRELRQNLSKYLDRVKAGEALVVTEHGREVARLVPSGRLDPAIERLLARGATMPVGDLLDVRWPAAPPVGTQSIDEILDDIRADRV